MADCDGMSQEEFNTNWAERMEGVVSAAEQQSGASGGKKVLLVCTSVDKFPDGSATGWYLPEAAHPYWKFVEAGHTVTWASIQGGSAPCDPSSVDASAEDVESMKFWNDAELKAKTVESTLKLEECSPDTYDAIFFAGGFGTMWDFPENEAAQKLIVSMYESGKPVAAVCHGPIVFLNVKLSDGTSLVSGKEITGFTNAEEEAVGKTEVVAKPSGPGSCEDALSEAGATFKDGGVFRPMFVLLGTYTQARTLLQLALLQRLSLQP